MAINRNLGSGFFDIIAEIRVHGTFSATAKRKTKTKSLELKFDMMDPIRPIFSRKQSKKCDEKMWSIVEHVTFYVKFKNSSHFV